MKKKRINNKRLYEILKFLVILNLFGIPLHLIMYFGNTYFIANIERAQVIFLLNLIGIKYKIFDVNYGKIYPAIQVGNKVLILGEACTSIRNMLAFVALVFSSPRKIKQKLKALYFLPIIYIANVLRIFTLAIFNSSPYFDFIHIFLWREGLIGLIIILWSYWLFSSKT